MLLTRVKFNTTDATTGATVMLQPAQNTIVVQVLYALHDPIETEHALALAAAAGGVEEHVESFDSDRDFVVVLLCRCMCSFLRVKCEQLSLQHCLQPMVTGTRVCPGLPAAPGVFLPEHVSRVSGSPGVLAPVFLNRYRTCTIVVSAGGPRRN